MTQRLTYCGAEAGKLHELRMLLARGLQFPCMIFLQSRDRARLLCREIAAKGAAKAGLLSGDLNQKQVSANSFFFNGRFEPLAARSMGRLANHFATWSMPSSGVVKKKATR